MWNALTLSFLILYEQGPNAKKVNTLSIAVTKPIIFLSNKELSGIEL
jgi:hypothetical protein